MERQAGPRVSVIVPARNCAGHLAAALAALEASDLQRDSWELIVVDDASHDETGAVAARHADTVIRLEDEPRGPGHARNVGAAAARGAILVFVDGDVCVHADVLRRFLEVLEADDGLAAVFGAYDVTPRAPGLVSQYRNLLHHYVHVTNAGEAETFWAGCGAIRRSAFMRMNGFDAARYPRPQIEDIELGYRLRAMGSRIVLQAGIQATHLKSWTLRSMIASDLLDRGVPWMRLLLDRGAGARKSLNVRLSERALTLLAVLALTAPLTTPFVGMRVASAAAGACLTLLVAGNVGVLAWFARVRGVRFALAVVPLRLLYYVLNAVAVVVASGERLLLLRWPRSTHMPVPQRFE
jgi:glycosyltransferase involved in cell wall biosynthesis